MLLPAPWEALPVWLVFGLDLIGIIDVVDLPFHDTYGWNCHL